MKKSTLASLIFLSIGAFSYSGGSIAAGKSYLKMTNTEKPIRADISADFKYEAKSIKIRDAQIQYFDEGEGDPVIFMHGIPTWSYLWRNVMPHLEKDARVIAMDFPGYGGSTRGSAKTLIDHSDYFEEFVNKLGLKNVTLVVHDLGAGVAMVYAGRNPENVRAIAFGESPFGQSYTDQPLPGMTFPKKVSERGEGFLKMMTNEKSRVKAVVKDNMFMTNGNFTYGITRQLTQNELDAYLQPFTTEKSRFAISDVVAGLTYNGAPAVNYEAVGKGLDWLASSDVPKLMFLLKNGSLMPAEVSDQITKKARNLTVVNLGDGRHFFQEDHPHKVGRHLKAWFEGTK